MDIPKMRIRRATSSDVPVMASIAVKAFAQEPIFGHMFPFKEQFPEDFAQYFVEDANYYLVTPGHMIIVAEIDEAVGGGHKEQSGSRRTKATVVGYACYIRHTSSVGELANWNPDSPFKG